MMKSNNVQNFDIVITGCGPASQVLASAIENALPEKKIVWIRDQSDLKEKKSRFKKTCFILFISFNTKKIKTNL